MSKFSLRKLVSGVQKFTIKHAPEILIGSGIAAGITGTVLTIPATVKAVRAVDTKKKEEEKDSLTKKEVFKTCWKYYIPPVTMVALSTASLLKGQSVHARRTAAITAAYTLSETAFSEYKEKVIETIGEKKEKEVRDKIAQDHIDRDPINNREVIITGKGDTTCYDTWSKRYFKSDLEKIRRAVNELNRQMIQEMYVSLNDFYDELGLSHSDLGYKMGWNLDKGLIDIYPSAQLDENDEPCIAISFTVEPQYNFDRLL